MRTTARGARKRLIRCAGTYMKRYGYCHAHIDDIASACGMSTRTLYCFFEDKISLFQTALTEDWRRTIDAMDAQMYLQSDICSRLCVIFDVFQKFHTDYYRSFMELEIHRDSSDQFHDILEQLCTDLEDRIRAALKISEIQGEISLDADIPLDDLSILIAENMLSIARNRNLDFRRIVKMILTLANTDQGSRVCTV